jgi:fatty aldehyde-generating acyl-ACP reductase
VLPHLRSRPPAFAFLTNLRDDRDLYRIGASRFLRRYSSTEDEFRDKMCRLPPLVAGEVVVGFGPIRGEVAVVMRMPSGLLGAGGARAIREGLEMVLRRGAAVVGLGGMTAPATAGGRKLLRDLPAGVTLTNANAFTAAVVLHNVIDAAASLHLERTATVAVVGCTGSVGVPASLLLAEHGFDLILIGRTAERVGQRLPGLARHMRCTGDLPTAAGADVVVLLTNDRSARLSADHVRPGAVVVDVAQPANIPSQEIESFARRGVPVVEGGIVRIPGYLCTVDLGMADPHDTAACVAETYLFAAEGIRTHSLGVPDEELARRLWRAALRRGIEVRPLGLLLAA